MSWTLEGYDTFAGEYYDLPGKYETREDAERAASERLQELEREQPSARSGGQTGIQDQVFVIGPDGWRYRRYQ